ncbi:MAG: propionyl-CoA synthetase [bacterium]|nr:propionyl-CoA synthetase [bacterium]
MARNRVRQGDARLSRTRSGKILGGTIAHLANEERNMPAALGKQDWRSFGFVR